MRDFVIPQNVQPEVGEALQQVREILTNVQIPTFKTVAEIRSITEGSAAYWVAGNSVRLFTKRNGKLFYLDFKEL